MAALHNKDKEMNMLIILRGFPGAGKSSLSKAIQTVSNKGIICSHDKYHWSGNAEGKGTFKFDYNIHRKTKDWCKEEILSAMKQYTPLVIVDNAHFAKWEYSEYIQWGQSYRYKIIIIEIKSSTKHISRHDHIQHMKQNKEISECVLCKMHRYRCKMSVPDHIFQKFIDKYEEDSNAIIVEPKLNKNEKWTQEEIKTLLSSKKSINYDEYEQDNYVSDANKQRPNKKRYRRNHNNYSQKYNHNSDRQTQCNQDPLDSTLDELIHTNRHKRRRLNHNTQRRRY